MVFENNNFLQKQVGEAGAGQRSFAPRRVGGEGTPPACAWRKQWGSHLRRREKRFPTFSCFRFVRIIQVLAGGDCRG
jgi:hypothetical protein